MVSAERYDRPSAQRLPKSIRDKQGANKVR